MPLIPPTDVDKGKAATPPPLRVAVRVRDDLNFETAGKDRHEVFGSGGRRSALHLCQALAELGHDAYLLVDRDDWDDYRAPGGVMVRSLCDVTGARGSKAPPAGVDLVVSVGAKIGSEEAASYRRGDVPVVTYRGGSAALEDATAIAANAARATLDPAPEIPAPFNPGTARAVWTPKGMGAIRYLQGMCGGSASGVHEVPFVWAPLDPERATGEEQGWHTTETHESLTGPENCHKRIVVIMQPNTPAGNCVVPLAAVNSIAVECESAGTQRPFGNALVVNGTEAGFNANPYFREGVVRALPAVQASNKAVYFSQEASFQEVFKDLPHLLVVHQPPGSEAEVTHLHLEALAAGVPMVHNNTTLFHHYDPPFNMNSYFKTNDPESCATAIKSALKTWENFESRAYVIRSGRKFVAAYHPTKADLTNLRLALNAALKPPLPPPAEETPPTPGADSTPPPAPTSVTQASQVDVTAAKKPKVADPEEEYVRQYLSMSDEEKARAFFRLEHPLETVD